MCAGTEAWHGKFPKGSREFSSDFCWKDSISRGAGRVPQKCKPGYERIALLCYKNCPAGFERYGTNCRQVCPEGEEWRDDCGYCRKKEYPRGVGIAPHRGLNGGCKNTTDEYHAGLCYDKCRYGYKRIATRCYKTCDGFGHESALYCHKPRDGYNHGRIGRARSRCLENEVRSQWLCYPDVCENGTHVYGPRCSVDCPEGTSDHTG